jgi:hypothetical protein
VQERLKWVGAGALFVVPVVVGAVLASDDEDTASQTAGHGLAIALIAVALTALARFVYIRLQSHGSEPMWTPTVLAASGAVGVVAALLVVPSNNEDNFAAFAEQVDRCRESGPSPLVNADAPSESGIEFQLMSPTQKSNVLAQGLPPGVSAEDADVRTVLVDDRPAGFVIAVPGFEYEDDLSDFLNGFRQGVEEQGMTADEVAILGTHAVVASSPHVGTVLATHSGCYGLVLATRKDGVAQDATNAILDD